MTVALKLEIRVNRVFLCFMYSTLIQEGPGVEPGEFLSSLGISSIPFALPLTLLGAPVDIGKARVRRRRVSWSPRPKGRPPGTGPHVSVRHNRGSDTAPRRPQVRKETVTLRQEGSRNAKKPRLGS